MGGHPRLVAYGPVGCWPQDHLEAMELVPTPVEVVSTRMTLYNEHDLEAFLALYSEGIEIFTYPELRLLGTDLQAPAATRR